MKNNGIKFKWKRRLKFRHIYAIALIAATAYFAYSVVELLIFVPMRATGTMILGSRMDEITLLEEDWLTETETFGATVDDVDYVDIFWNLGPVVYVSVRIEPGTSRTDARSAARTVVEHLIEISDEVALQYDIQVVVSYGDVSEQVTENQAALVLHVHEYNHSFVESLITHAERYPSQYNIDRPRANILNQESVTYNSIRIVAGDEGRAEMLARIDAITPLTEEELEEEGPLPRHPERQISSSNIARFPLWGTWNNERSRISWSP